MGSVIEVPAQPVTRAWSSPSSSIGSGTFQSAYWLYFSYKSRVALLAVLMARSNGFSPRFLRESLDGIAPAERTEEEVDNAAWERPANVSHATRLLKS